MPLKGTRGMGEIQAYGCPLCGRVAKTSAGLLEQGCEGMHEALMLVSEVEPLVEAVRETLCDEDGCTRCAPLRAALKPFEDPQ